MRRHRVRRIVLWSLASVLALVVVLVGVTVIALNTDWGRDKLRRQIESQLATVFVRGATIREVVGSPLGTLELRDIVIDDAAGVHAVVIGRIRAALDLTALVHHTIEVSELTIDDVDVDAARAATLLTPQPDGPPSAWTIALDAIAVHRAHVRLPDEPQLGRVDLDDIAVRGRLRLDGSGGAKAAMVAARATWRQRAARVNLIAVAGMDRDALAVPALAVEVGDVAVWGVQLHAVLRDGQPPAISGRLAVDAPRAAVNALVPDAGMPSDVAAVVEASPATSSAVPVAVAARVDAVAIRASLVADVAAWSVHGTAWVGDADLAAVTRGGLAGVAGTTLQLDIARGSPGGWPRGTVAVTAHATVGRIPRVDVVAALASDGTRVTIDATAAGPARAHVAATVVKAGDAIALESARVVAATDQLRALTGGAAPVQGNVRAELTATGKLSPDFALAVNGTTTAKQLVVGGVALGDATISAATRPDGRIAVDVRSTPARSGWQIALAALVTLPGDRGVTVVDLGHHEVHAGPRGGVWRGDGGRVTVSAVDVAIAGVRSASANGQLRADGRLIRAGAGSGDLTAAVNLDDFHVVALDKGWAGQASAHVNVARRRGAWTGSVDASARGVALTPMVAPIAATVAVKVEPRHLVATVDASAPRLGGVRVDADMDAPARVEDVAAWRRLGRAAVHLATLTFHDFDLAKAAALAPAGAVPAITGTLDGSLSITATSASGTLRARGVHADAMRELSRVDGSLALARPAVDEIDPTIEVRADAVGSATATLQLAVPDRPFDPAAWRLLGRAALRGGHVEVGPIAVDPAMLARLGVDSTARGKLHATVDVGERAKSIQLVATLTDLRATAAAAPVDAQIDAQIDDTGTRVRADATAAHAPLVHVDGTAQVTLAELVAAPSRARTAAVTATVTMAKAPAARLVAALGRADLTRGTIDGEVHVDGTVAAPRVHATLTADDLATPTGQGAASAEAIKHLAVDATWGVHGGTMTIDGTGAGGGTLAVRATLDPQDLAAATAKITAKQFDLAPMLAFAPGPVGAARARLDADLTVTGFDPRVTQLAGQLHLRQAHLPIAAQVGTLREASIDVDVHPHDIAVKVDGKLGDGTAVVTGSITVAGATMTGGNLVAKLRHVSPIGAVEPRIDADVTAKLGRSGTQWTADVTVDRGAVKVGGTGEQLKPVGLPADMEIAGRPVARSTDTQVAATPIDPFLVAHIVLHDTKVEADQFRTTVHGDVKMSVDANTVGMTGTIAASGGNVELFARRYRVDRGSVYFDGSIDPLLDIELSYDFPDVTTVTQVRGRLSKPELVLTSNPGIYNETQLLGFLLGGEPGGNPNSASARDQAQAAGESLVASQLAGYVRKALPINIDVLRYQAASLASSAAITVGSWITHTLFLSFSQHISPLPDENSDEATLEWWLTHRLEVQATAGDRNYDTVDLLWRRRF
jgi:hypothetical protein